MAEGRRTAHQGTTFAHGDLYDENGCQYGNPFDVPERTALPYPYLWHPDRVPPPQANNQPIGGAVIELRQERDGSTRQGRVAVTESCWIIA